MSRYNVAVYGATGHTGRFVASGLERRGVAVRRIARHPPTESSSQNDGGLSSWVGASCDDPESLDRALDGSDAIINCAGPFLDTAPAVIESALRVGAHYFDVAAEQRSVRQSLATYSAEARDRGIVVLPAMAFYGGLADLLAAQICAGLQVIEEILVGVALDQRRALGVQESEIRRAGSSCRKDAWLRYPLPRRGDAGSFRCRLEISLYQAFHCRKSLRFLDISTPIESKAS